MEEIIDYGIEGNNFKQTTKSLQPSLCLESEKENNKYFLKFNGGRMISNSNINPSKITSKTVSGETILTIGDIKNNTNSPFDGSISFFSILKHEKMTEKEILFYHYVLCNLYNVDHNPINI